MTGFESKRSAAQDKLNDEADTLTIVYQRGFADGKRSAERKPLTNEQLDDIAVVARRGNLHDLRISIEAKLKEQP